jgi:AcrR family transcriptional regulator
MDEKKMTDTSKKPRMPKGQGKDRLIKHSKILFLENGYESTSPQDIYKSSGVGQGSFYHHFSSKADLMKTVLDEICETESHSLHRILKKDSSAKDKLNEFLDQPRKGKNGCKFGRFIYESSVVNSDIAIPIRNYFQDLEESLDYLIGECQKSCSVTQCLSSKQISQTIIAQIQGGYILSRVKESDIFLANSITSIKKLIFNDEIVNDRD